ncbi:SacI homology domain-containing protein [Phlyctochytrium arcticum]|nr:SacI homology domain-containing protein [Phlyctochytrium arcticum]
MTWQTTHRSSVWACGKHLSFSRAWYLPRDRRFFPPRGIASISTAAQLPPPAGQQLGRLSRSFLRNQQAQLINTAAATPTHASLSKPVVRLPDPAKLIPLLATELIPRGQIRSAMIHESLNLYISSETFTVEPIFLDPSIRRETLVINRGDASLQLNAPPSPTLRQEEVVQIHGLIGIIHLNAGDHIVIITDRRRVGTISGHDIYKLTGHKIIPVQRSKLHLSEHQIQDDLSYVMMLDSLLGAQCFYFSYSFDITNTLQRQAEAAEEGGNKAVWEKADERFFWNRFMNRKLMNYSKTNPENHLNNFILPIMCGFIEIVKSNIQGQQFTFALISRRNHHRAGTRYHSRGVDADGNVSNNVETEQVVITESGMKSAYVQTRGSIPLYWRQVANIRYQPKLVIDPNPQTAASFRKHFEDQIKRYGGNIAVNLINKKGYEQRLGDEFAKHARLMNEPRLKYVHFDFHHECRKMRWDRISVLLDEIRPELEKQGYFRADAKGLVLNKQTSVVRSNCMDCLDRTNVVQSVLARTSLRQQFVDLGILPADGRVEDAIEFERTYKHMWADNADEVSKQYSGTGALKTDFTRGGKRTRAGALQDFRNSAVRYFKNNFLDGSRQDAFNLFLGVYEVNPTIASPFLQQDKPLRYLAIPLGIVLSIFMIMVVHLATPYSASWKLIFSALWIGIMYFLIKLMVKYGTDYVDMPRLAAKLVTEADAASELLEMQSLTGLQSRSEAAGKSAEPMPETSRQFSREKDT